MAAFTAMLWVLVAGQFWVQDHPFVRVARSSQGLLLEWTVLVHATGIGLIVGCLAWVGVRHLHPGYPAGRKRLGILSVAVTATVLFWMTAPERGDDPLQHFDGITAQDFNVVFITLDTQRADYLGCYGSPTLTPNLDRIASEGALFERAFSTTNTTLPSHASIFTSLWMKEHGIVSNFSPPLSESHVTTMDVFSRLGYRTGAFTSFFLLNRDLSGLLRHVEESWAPERSFARSEEAMTRALEFVDRHQAEPFFLWLHTYDVHRPYKPLAPYDTLYYQGDPYDPENLSFADIPPIHPRPPGITDIEYYPAMYQGETTYQDDQLGRLFDQLRALDLMDRTLLIVTADHGESLGEHDLFYTHEALYVEDTHVPLLIRFPHAVPAGLRLAPIVQTIDIFPTVLELLELPGLAGVSGESLVPILQGSSEPVREMAYLEGRSHAAIGVVDDGWTFLHPITDVVPNHNPELFRTREDPDQLVNEYYRHRDVSDRYETAAEEFLGRPLRSGRATKTGIRPTVQQQLNALGYVR